MVGVLAVTQQLCIRHFITFSPPSRTSVVTCQAWCGLSGCFHLPVHFPRGPSRARGQWGEPGCALTHPPVPGRTSMLWAGAVVSCHTSMYYVWDIALGLNGVRGIQFPLSCLDGCCPTQMWFACSMYGCFNRKFYEWWPLFYGEQVSTHCNGRHVCLFASPPPFTKSFFTHVRAVASRDRGT